jgi:hypothetical protein
MDLRVGGKWKLSKKLGSGAFGEIYQGKSMNSLSLDSIEYYYQTPYIINSFVYRCPD